MTHKIHRELLVLDGERCEFELARPSASAYAMLEELSFMRREAQIEATQAYEDWHESMTGETWAIYRAAQDRADAAQDALADWVRQLA